MRKILATTSVALFTAIAVMATAAPASAGGGGGVHFSIGLGGFGPGWGPGYGYGYDNGYGGGGVYVNNWAAHVDWCYDHKGPSYNPGTNTYVKHGKIRVCHSPFA